MPKKNKSETITEKVMEEIIDTNIILRYLVRDVEPLYKKAVEIFKEAEKRKRKILVKPLIIAEACFVLESFYKKHSEEIADSLEVFLSQNWLKVEERDTMLNLWFWYRKNLHFVDSYLLSWAKINESKILSFDQKLIKNLN